VANTTTDEHGDETERLFCPGCERWFSYAPGPELVTCPTCGDRYDPVGGSRMKMLKRKG
jgi:LSD1 subclass zinc finger protein